MPSIGPEVGDAYIQVHADTDALRRELRGNLAAEMRRFAARTNSTFKTSLTAFDENQFAGFRRGLASVARSGDWTTLHRQMGGTSDSIKDMFRLLEELGKRNYFGDTEDELEDLLRSLVAYSDQIAKTDRLQQVTRETRAWQDQVRVMKALTPEVERTAQAYREMLRVANEKRGAGVDEREWTRYVAGLRGAVVEFERLEARAARASDAAAKKFQADLERSQGAYSKFFDGWKKSRNDFIHALGIFMDAISTGIGRMVENSVNGLQRLVGYFKPGGGGFGQMFKDLGSSLASFGSLIARNWVALAATAVALIVAFEILGSLVGAFVSLLSGAIGILTAFASSLGMALFALVPIVGAGVGAAYGIGLMTAALKDMDKYLPDAVGGLNELKRVFTEVDVRAFAEGIEGPLNNLLRTLASSLETDKISGALGRAFGGVMDSMTAVIKSPAWTAFMAALTEEIPRAIDKFGAGFGGFLQGLFSSFAAGAPAVEKMADHFRVFGDNFARTMDEAQKSGELTEFFNLAGESLTVITDLAWEVGEALAALFKSAGPAGNEMLRTLTGMVEKFTAWVTSAEGQQQINDWMEFAKEVFKEVGLVLGEVVEQFKRLDTPENRDFALSLIRGFRNLIGVIGNVLSFMSHIGQMVRDVYNAITGLWGGMWQGLLDGWNAVKTFFTGRDWSGEASGWFSGLWQSIKDWWNNLDWVDIALSIWTGLVSGISGGLPGHLTSILGFFQAIIDGVKKLFGIASPSTVFEDIGEDVVQGLWDGVEDKWGDFAKWFDGVQKTLVSTARTSWDTIATQGRERWDTIRAVVTERIEALRSAVMTRWENIKTYVLTKADEIRNNLSGKWDEIRNRASAAWDSVGNVVSNRWDEIRNGVSRKIGEVAAVVGTLGSRAISAIGNVGSTLWNAGYSLIQGLLNGLNAAWGAVEKRLVQFSKSIPKLKGPPAKDRVLLEPAGRLIIQGLRRGMEREYGAVESSLSQFTQRLSVAGGGPLPVGQAFTATTRNVTVAPGAIQLTSAASNPRLLAGMLLDDMVVRVGG